MGPEKVHSEMKILARFVFGFFFFLMTAQYAETRAENGAKNPYPINYRLDGISGRYTEWVRKAVSEPWPPKVLDFKKDSTSRPEDPIQLVGIETPQERYSIGLAQQMKIRAPFERVEAILDDINGYQKLFPDYKNIQVESREQNLSTSYWEQKVPFFFVPNVRFWMIYLTEKTKPTLKLYRYQLKKSSALKASDGVIGIEALSNNEVMYTEFDFFDANWGVIASMASDRIWRESIEAIYLSDAAIRYKAEHPDVTSETALGQARGILQKFPVSHAVERRKVLLK